MFQFIVESGECAAKAKDTQRAIRSQAMKSVRKRQKDQGCRPAPGSKASAFLRNSEHTAGGSVHHPQRIVRPTVSHAAEKETPSSLEEATAYPDRIDLDHDKAESTQSPECLPHRTQCTSPKDQCLVDLDDDIFKPGWDTPDRDIGTYIIATSDTVESTDEDAFVHLSDGLSSTFDENTCTDPIALRLLASGVTTETVSRSHVSYRDQLRRAFITSYYADPVLLTSHRFIRTYFWHLPASRAMTASQDALMLIHLGSRFRNVQLMQEGERVHCYALHLLRTELESSDVVFDDGVLAACYTLAHCQIYQALSRGSSGWQVHIDGLLHILRRRGPNSISSPFAKAYVHNIRQIAVMDQLLRRRRSILSQPEWTEPGEGLEHVAIRLTNCALAVSGFTEDVGFELRGAGEIGHREDSRSATLLDRMALLEADFHQCLTTFCNSQDLGPHSYWTAGIWQYPYFREQCPGLDGLLPRVYEFSSFLSATTHVYVWICRLAMYVSVIEMITSELSKSVPDRYGACLEAGDECAAHLCRSLAYLSAPEHRSAGVLACSGPLHWAEKWYIQRGDRARSFMCQRLRKYLEQDHPTPLDMTHPVFCWWMLPDISTR